MSVDEAARISRRALLRAGAGGAAAVGLGTTFLPDLLDRSSANGPARAARSSASSGGYGPLQRADELGISLPAGFRARLMARAGERVPGTGYELHGAPDGAATFATRDGGWILVSNSEMPDGGAGAIRFRADGSTTSAYRILDGTEFNCSGGATPWNTWLSCEEVLAGGYVWECDPWGRKDPVVHEAMGRFKHEAAAVDPVGRHVYLTEDLNNGLLYRYTPTRWPRLGEGLLEAATVARDGAVSWARVRDPSARLQPTRLQVPGATVFYRAEGVWLWGRGLYVGTTSDSTLRRLDLRTGRMEVVYTVDWPRLRAAGRTPVLNRIDQMTASPAGEVFICEDDHEASLTMGCLRPPDSITPFLRVSGSDHHESELTGVAFAPGGKRLYFSSQRAFGSGAIYEVTGPFRRRL